MRPLVYLLALAALPCVLFALISNEVSKLTPADGATGDAFGWSMALDGTTLVVGAKLSDSDEPHSGAAYVFDMTGGNLVTKLVPIGGNVGDEFGHAVAVSGNLVAVGSPYDQPLGPDSGSAYVYDAVTGAQLHKLLPDLNQSGDLLGISVAIHGSTVLVGASQWGNGGPGVAFLFDANSGLQKMKLQATDGAAGDNFGHALAMNGTRAVIGAFTDDDLGEDTGSAYVFDTVTGAQLAKLSPADATPFGLFGLSVAVNDTLALIGSDGPGLHSASGSAYLFDLGSGAQVGKLLHSGGSSSDFFGSSVGLSADRAIVGAPGDGTNGLFAGAAYRFALPSLAQLDKLLPSDGSQFDTFGVSVAIGPSTTVVGASRDDDNGAESGSIYLFGDPGSGTNSGAPFCFGDGTGAACPCAAFGNPGQGCRNTSGQGAVLVASGEGSFSNDTLQLAIQGVPGAKAGLVLRGDNQVSNPIGDGILCTSGGSLRSQIQVTVAGETVFSDFQGSPFGSVANSGTATHFQFWYRDSTNPCSGLGFNFTNGWTITYLP